MRTLLWCLASCLLIHAPILRAVDESTYRNSALGFSITKPSTWVFDTRSSDADAGGVSVSPVKIVGISRYKEPYPDLNASLAVSFVAREKVAVTVPKTLARIYLNRIEQRYADAAIQEGPDEVTVAGFSGAYARVFFEAQSPEGQRFPASAEVWVLTVGELFCVATAESRQDEKTGSRKEIWQILETMKMDAK